jgi:hypothetical protein
MEDNMVTEETKLKIYNHLKRIFSLINKVEFEGSLKLELQEFKEIYSNYYIYLIPHSNFPGDDFFEVNFEEVASYLNKKYKNMMSFKGDNREGFIITYFDRSLELAQFINTMDLDDISFELWFKLEYK